jgi:methyl-accepting chemotaxis protein
LGEKAVGLEADGHGKQTIGAEQMTRFFLDLILGRSIAVRLVWISISFLLPVAVLFNIYIAAADKDIIFADKELVGVSYLARVTDTLRPILAHRALVDRGHANDEQARRLRTEADRAIEALEREESRAGKSLDFTPDGLKQRKREGCGAADLRREWEALKLDLAKIRPAQADERQARVLDIILSMVAHLTDTSNLILDPDLDSYYLMDAATAALPSLARRLSDFQARQALRDAEKTKDKNDSTMLEIQILARRGLEDDLARAVKAVESAISEDDKFHGHTDGLADLSPMMDSLSHAVEEAFATMAKPQASSDSRVTEAMEKTLAAQKSVAEHLEILLRKRIGKFSQQKTTGSALTLFSLLLAIVLVFWIGRGIVVPISKSRTRLMLLANGDLAAPVAVLGQGELRQMTESLSVAVESMRNVVTPMRAGANDLTGAAEKQRKTSLELTSNAEETSTQAQVVSAAAEQVSANVRSVAAAAEEMDATIREIASQAHQAARVATDAVELAQSTGGLVSRLGESGSRIGGVVKLITSIAEQTNLLALNATIEAARAGEVGKGFAVVANEVKELAKETAKATEDISSRIGAIQQDTEQAVRAITEIQGTIRRISEIQSAIASAVEEQSATTREIGRNVTEAARGTSDIASNITGVASAARGTSSGAHEVSSSSEALLRLAGNLRKLIEGFRSE